MTYEEQILRIEEIIAELSEEKVTLENSLELFSEGARLLSKCGHELDEVKEKAEILLTEGNYEV
ncbi:MAG: exodeoxyribonuclease VII small subunit [Oscillospiraceae bacterium]